MKETNMNKKDINSIKTINYNFFHWGPFLYKTKLTNEEIDKIKKLCKKYKKKDFRKNLAGLIKQEYEIDNKKLFSVIFSYFQSYCKAYLEYSGRYLYKQLELKSAWVNYMTKFESNPLHTHDGDLSFVLFTKVPKDLKKEFNDTLSKTKPGCINFIISLYPDKAAIYEHKFFPEVGDLFIFPATLNHYVNSFKCEGERVSVSGNIVVNK